VNPASTAFADYVRGGLDEVEGWVSPSVIPVLYVLDEASRAVGSVGGACEIGVHHGRLFIALLALVGAERRSLAIDLFEN
jgi:hypothetical protein